MHLEENWRRLRVKGLGSRPSWVVGLGVLRTIHALIWSILPVLEKVCTFWLAEREESVCTMSHPWSIESRWSRSIPEGLTSRYVAGGAVALSSPETYISGTSVTIATTGPNWSEGGLWGATALTGTWGAVCTYYLLVCVVYVCVCVCVCESTVRNYYKGFHSLESALCSKADIESMQANLDMLLSCHWLMHCHSRYES